LLQRLTRLIEDWNIVNIWSIQTAAKLQRLTRLIEDWNDIRMMRAPYQSEVTKTDSINRGLKPHLTPSFDVTFLMLQRLTRLIEDWNIDEKGCVSLRRLLLQRLTRLIEDWNKTMGEAAAVKKLALQRLTRLIEDWNLLFFFQHLQI